MKNILVICLCLLGFAATAQDAPQDEVFKIVEDMPEYPGGKNGLTQYMMQIPYPDEAKASGQEGTVYVEFIINKTGKPEHIKVARSSGYPLLDEVALNHVNGMEHWTPGKQPGKAVKVQYVLPVKFKLSAADKKSK